jgi:hypothetical protein
MRRLKRIIELIVLLLRLSLRSIPILCSNSLSSSFFTALVVRVVNTDAFHADLRRDSLRFMYRRFVFVMVLSCGYKLGSFLLWLSCWSCSSS